MAYPKTIWVNDIPGVQEGTPIDADNMNKIEKGIQQAHKLGDVQTVGGTGTAITISDFGLDAYYTGLKVTFIAGANNGGAATTINIDGKGAKSIFKPNTAAAPNFVAGKAYTIYYNGTSFFWQASAEGNAVVADVLAGKTFSNDDDSGLVGAMVDRAGDTAALSLARSGTTIRLRASEGYRDGTNDFVTHTDVNDLAANIKKDIAIRGITGTLTPKETLLMPTVLGDVSYQLMSVDEDYNTYWGSKWVHNKYEVRNKSGTLLRIVTISTGDTHRLLGCGKFGFTKNKLSANTIVQHYLENGTFVREFTKGVSDNADPYFFNGNGYVAMTDGSPRKISRWNVSGTFLGNTDLFSSIEYILNSESYVVFQANTSTARVQAVRPDNSVTDVTYAQMSRPWIEYHNYKV